MPLKHIFGVDHVVITVRDLDAAATQWKNLGFTVSPRGTHSPLLGTGNYTIMFQEDYLELLGVLTETDQNAPTRDFLSRREGIERTAFTTDSAADGAALLKSRGLEPLGPVHFGRPVDLPNGGTGEAKFNVFRWPLSEKPGGMRIFACQHLTRETVWIDRGRARSLSSIPKQFRMVIPIMAARIMALKTDAPGSLRRNVAVVAIAITRTTPGRCGTRTLTMGIVYARAGADASFRDAAAPS